MQRRTWVWLGGGTLMCFAAVLAGVVCAHAGVSRKLSDTEMRNIRGLFPECQSGYIDYEDPWTECFYIDSLFGQFENACDYKQCVSSGGCGSGQAFSGAYIPKYTVAGTSCDEELKTDTSVACHLDVDCESGEFVEMQQCNDNGRGGCEEPDEGTYPSGCRSCSRGQEHTLSLVSKTDPRYEPCPCAEQGT